MISEPKGDEAKQEKKVEDLTNRVEAAQKELQTMAKSAGGVSLLQAAQSRMVSRVAESAASAIEARGETFPELSSCSKMSENTKTLQEAAEAKCLCVTDKTCEFAATGHGIRATKMCNL